MQIKLRQFPTIINHVSTDNLNYTLKDRDDLSMNLKCEKKFEEFLIKMIPRQIPAVYIEGYEKILTKVENKNWPSNPKIILTAICYIYDDFFKISDSSLKSIKIHSSFLEIFNNQLDKLGIENRPIISGNFLKQPALRKYNIKQKSKDFPNANYVHEYGLHVGLENKIMNRIEIEKFVNIFVIRLQLSRIKGGVHNKMEM